jgi:hypothetical protein
MLTLPVKLIPLHLTIDKFRSVIKEQISIEKEFIESYDVLSQNQKLLLKDFFNILANFN